MHGEISSQVTNAVIVIVTGRSMEKLFENGDRVICVAEKKYKRGDIVLMVYDDMAVVHRILKVRGKRFLEGGDNGIGMQWHNRNTIVGRISILYRNDKWYFVKRNFFSFINGIFTFVYCSLNKKFKLHAFDLGGLKKCLRNILFEIRAFLQKRQLSEGGDRNETAIDL